MGARGPAPKPSHLKLVEGTHRKDRAPKNEPKPKVEIPNPPAWLGKGLWGRESIREWRRIAGQLAALGLVSELDRSALINYCEAFGRFWYYRREVNANGWEMEVGENGYRQITPAASELRKAAEDLDRYGSRFGMNPSARSRVEAARADDAPADPAEGYFT